MKRCFHEAEEEGVSFSVIYVGGGGTNRGWEEMRVEKDGEGGVIVPLLWVCLGLNSDKGGGTSGAIVMGVVAAVGSKDRW